MKKLLTTNLGTNISANVKRALQKKKNQAMLILMGICLILCLVAGFIIYNHFKPRPTPIPEIKTSLEKVIDRNDLNTIEYPVNRAITVWDKDGKRKKYYVSYEATVKAGIDMSKVTVEVIEPKKENEKPKIVVTLPEAKYDNPTIDPNSYDFLFIKQKYETETVLEEAVRACEKDLRSYIEQEVSQKEIARENAVRYMKAFLLPFEQEHKNDCIIEVR